MIKHADIKQRFGILGNSPKLDRAIEVALQVAPTDISVLLQEKAEQVKKQCLKSSIIRVSESMEIILP